MLFIVLQNNCDEFWSWSWAYPIICAFILGIILGWILSKIFGNQNKDCSCCDGVKAELEACRSNVKLLTNREITEKNSNKKAKAQTSKSTNEKTQIEVETNKKIASKKTSSKKTPKKETKTITKKEASKKAIKETEKKTEKKETKIAAPKKRITAKKATKKSTKNSDRDDLTKVEGIGPKIQEHFNNGGILTWKELAATEVSKLQEILDEAGTRYRIHNPESWPLQAGMCANGEWDKLKKWQDEHKAGRF